MKSPNYLTTAISGLLVSIGMLTLLLYIVAAFHSEPNQQICVKDKQVVVSAKSSKYLIFSSDNKSYEITDSLIHGRWDSSDVFSYITRGKCYKTTLQGYRIPFFSMYQNIINPIEIK